ncbi:hypothetical protein [Brevundimonas sp. NPDC058933]|uniref:hypothetical protein n=1 Tax=Brevundimonas sp. NPDC058933 TaxID=3346673 RepID=UPI003BEEB36E
MQQHRGLSALFASQNGPAILTGFPGGDGASAGRRGVQDRSIQQRVNNLVVGHAALPLFNIPNLIAGPRNGYGAKREIVQ